VAILVDDADIWGRILSGWARELPSLRKGALFGCAVRSTTTTMYRDMEMRFWLEQAEAEMRELP
jgi:hypothetical protein